MNNPNPPKWTPCRELEAATADDSPQPEQIHVQWKNALAAKILDALPHPIGIARGYNRNQITSDIVKLVIDAVGQADQILAELHERYHDACAARDSLRTMVDTMIVTNDELTAELERARDAHQQCRIELDRLLEHHINGGK